MVRDLVEAAQRGDQAAFVDLVRLRGGRLERPAHFLPRAYDSHTTPAAAANSIESGNGKKASEARTDPRARSPAFLMAISTLSTRLICPAPAPTSARSRHNTMALDFTYRTTDQANRRSVRWSSVG